MNISKVRKGYQDFITQWNWDLYAHLTFRNPVSFSTAFKIGKNWLRKIKQTYTDLRFAGLLFLADPNRTTPHLHCVLVSDPSYPRTLSDIPKRQFEDLWPCLCKIRTNAELTLETMAGYISKPKNITYWDWDRWDFEVYRPYLLSRLMDAIP